MRITHIYINWESTQPPIMKPNSVSEKNWQRKRDRERNRPYYSIKDVIMLQADVQHTCYILVWTKSRLVSIFVDTCVWNTLKIINNVKVDRLICKPARDHWTCFIYFVRVSTNSRLFIQKLRPQSIFGLYILPRFHLEFDDLFCHSNSNRLRLAKQYAIECKLSAF